LRLVLVGLLQLGLQAAHLVSEGVQELIVCGGLV
jgi:hypothetical protein